MGARRFRVAAAWASAALLLAGCAGDGTREDDAASGRGTWTAVPSAPLSPRLGAVTAWTGTEALFLGGDVDGLCSWDGSCPGPPESAADGAAFDPAAQTWRPVADAPHPIPGGTSSTVDGDTVVLAQGDRVLSYDTSEDAWSVSPAAPHGQRVESPAVLDDGTVALLLGERHDGDPSGLHYDPATRTWSELPEDPLGPSSDRTLTAVPGRLVLTAVDRRGASPRLRAAVLDEATRTWTTLGGSGRTGGRHWSWTGRRLVHAAPDGGALDPRTGAWEPLPGTPRTGGDGWPVDATGGAVAAVDGWVYDDGDRTWTPLGRPAGAPAEPGSAVWAGDELLVLGGMDADAGRSPEHLSDRAWVWRPSASSVPASAVDDLTGRRWVLESQQVDGEVQEPIGVRVGSLRFRADGTVDVDTGCVEGTTRWRASGDTVQIDEFGWYGLACTEADLDAQGPLFDTWSSFRPTVEGDVLTLVPVNPGAPTLVYTAG